MLHWINDTPLIVFIMFAVTLGLAPFIPEPHIWEKIKMIRNRTLTRPLDIFDFVMHCVPWGLLLIKLLLIV